MNFFRDISGCINSMKLGGALIMKNGAESAGETSVETLKIIKLEYILVFLVAEKHCFGPIFCY